jgi:archaellum component FlaC
MLLKMKPYRTILDIQKKWLEEIDELLCHASNDLGVAENLYHLKGTKEGNQITKIREQLERILDKVKDAAYDEKVNKLNA